MLVQMTIETEVTGSDLEWVQKLLRNRANAIKLTPEAFVAAPKGVGQLYNDNLNKPFEILELHVD